MITHTNPVHALLYLDYFAAGDFQGVLPLGAYFAGALEIIVYAGAIMVLFVFVVMMLNPGGSEIEQERQWLKPQVWIGPAILSAIMLVVIVYAILGLNDQGIDGTPISAKSSGYYAVRALRTGGGTGFYAAARGSGCGLPRRS